MAILCEAPLDNEIKEFNRYIRELRKKDPERFKRLMALKLTSACRHIFKREKTIIR